MANHQRASAPRLLIRHELRLVRVIELTGEPVTIGRSSGCEIQLIHDQVSPLHATLEPRAGRWHLSSHDPGRAVRVNGVAVAEADLEPGDVIDISPFAINFVEDGATVEDLDRSIPVSAAECVATFSRDAGDAGSIVRQRLDDLYAIARLVLSRKDNGSFWHIMHSALQRCLGADRCVVVGVSADSGIFRLAPRARPDAAEAPLNISRSVLRDAIRNCRAMLIEQVASDDRYAGVRSLVDAKSGSVICVPVVVERQVRAVVYADRSSARAPFEPDDLDFAVGAVDLAATAVSMDDLQDHARELARVRGRIEVGRSMQKMLLPAPLPQPPWAEVAAVNVPADQMSGDIYDAQLDARGRLVVSLADVSGKGVPAAFVTAILQGSFRQALWEHEDLPAVVRAVNATLDKFSSAGCFATMVVCRWTLDGAEVEVANAGHHAPLWLQQDGAVVAYPDRVGQPLGITPDWTDETVQRAASRDVALVLSSDGVTECADGQKRPFGLPRLAELLPGLAGQSADQIAADLVRRVREFCAPAFPTDDLTLLVVKRRPT